MLHCCRLRQNMTLVLTCVVFQVEGLQSTISRLQAENVEYRDNSKSEQFEAQILELQQKLHQTGVLGLCNIHQLRAISDIHDRSCFSSYNV